MYKLILIDDDALALHGLAEIIKENSPDFEVAGAFTSGIDALEYIKNNHIDVIISDIKMPALDGLEIAKIINKNFSHIRMILLSSYSFFEYAQSALKYNVFRYILKPIDYEELSIILNELKKELDNTSVKANENFLPNRVFLERHQLFSNLLCGFISEKSILTKSMADVGIDVDLNKDKCCISYAQINNFSEYMETKWHYDRESLYTAISRLMPNDSLEMFCVFSRYSWNTLEFIFFCRDNTENFSLNIDNFFKTLKLNLIDCLSISIITNDSHEIYNSFFDLLQNRFNLPINDVAQNHITNFVIPYINEHFAEQLTLQSVASLIPMNASYFSVYFKQITHENFIDYLTKTRMTKAKELIEKTDYSIANVCNMVGYKNLSHFYSTFKKFYNTSPAEYRRQKNKK